MTGSSQTKSSKKFMSCARINGFETRPSTTKERKEDIDFVIWRVEEGKPVDISAVSIKNTLLKKNKKRKQLWGWVELRQRNGDYGWLYRKCTFIVYERKNDFVLIFKKDLKDWIEKNNLARWDLPFVDTGWKASYRLYRRPNTQEAIFQIKISDAIKNCRSHIWPKA